MKKNILVISASPRKGGNSDLLCDQLIKGVQTAGHQVEKIFLRDKRHTTSPEYHHNPKPRAH